MVLNVHQLKDYVLYIILRKHEHECIPNGVNYWAMDKYKETVFLVVCLHCII